MSKRFVEIDVLKGITMILVIVGHFWHPHAIAWAIWSFHMPCFVLVSGYLFNKTCTKISSKSIRIIKAYMIPYGVTLGITIILRTLYLFMYQILKKAKTNYVNLLVGYFLAGVYNSGNGEHIKFFNCNSGMDIPSVGVIWFLAALCMGELIFNLSFILKKYVRVLFLILLYMVACISVAYVQIPLAFCQGTAFALWLEIGYEIKRILRGENSFSGLSNRIKSFFYSRISVAIAAVIWVLVYYLELCTNIPFNIDSMKMPLYGAGSVGAICGSFLTYKLAVFIKRENFIIHRP